MFHVSLQVKCCHGLFCHVESDRNWSLTGHELTWYETNRSHWKVKDPICRRPSGSSKAKRFLSWMMRDAWRETLPKRHPLSGTTTGMRCSVPRMLCNMSRKREVWHCNTSVPHWCINNRGLCCVHCSVESSLWRAPALPSVHVCNNRADDGSQKSP